MRNGTRRISAAFAFVILTAFAWAKPSLAEKLPVETFAQLPSVSKLEISPDGEYLAMLRPHGDLIHVWIIKMDGSINPVVVPPIQDSEISWFTWANNDRLLVSLRRDTNSGSVLTRLMGVNKDGSNYENLNSVSDIRGRLGRDAREQLQDRIVDMLPNDPDHILQAFSDFDNIGTTEVRRLNVNTGHMEVIQRSKRGVQSWSTDYQGRIRLGAGFDNNVIDMRGTDKLMYYYRDPDQEFKEIPDFEIAEGLKPAGFDENPYHMYLEGVGEYGTDKLVKFDLSTNQIIETIFEHEQYDVGRLMTDPYAGKAVGYLYYGEKLEMVFFDREWQERYKLVNEVLPDTTNMFVSRDAAGTKHIVLARSDREPGVYFLFDEETMNFQPIAFTYENLDPAPLAEVRPVYYEARDGLTIPAYLTLPKNSDGKNLPTVILPHGGPFVRDSMEFDYLAQFIANRGYAVLQPNYRGSTGYGKAFFEAGHLQYGLAMQDDVTDGTKWLIDEGIADPDRICIAGWSYGGYAALMGVVKEPELYKCSVSINGVTDLERLLVDIRNYIGSSYRARYINKESQGEVSPLQQADRIQTPVLLIAARDDTVVRETQSKLMHRALKKNDVPTRYVRLNRGGHSLIHTTARLTALTELEKWLDKYIGD